MTCEESVERMSEILDGLPSEELEAHLGGCPSCREGLDGMRRADEALRRHPSIEWRPAMTEAILRRARSPARRFLLVAACLAVAAIASFLLLRRDPEIPREPLARHVSAVRCMAEQEGLAALDRDVLSSQARLLRLQELTAEISKSPRAAPIEGYCRQSSRPIESPADVACLWGSAREVQASCGLFLLPARIEPVVDPTPADLYAAGRLHFANGDPAQAVRALDGLLERHPESLYADPSCVTLASHFSKAGDDVSALAFYASIRKPGTITPVIAREIQDAGRRAGRAFAGPRPLAEADLDALRRCAESRTPYGLVRVTPEGRAEMFLLGSIRPELQVPPEPVGVCPSLATRRVRIDPERVGDPLLREMLGAMRGLAK